jgi:DNA-binding MarR family transcriptional regulator
VSSATSTAPSTAPSTAAGAAAESRTADPIELARQNWIAAGWDDAADGMVFVTSLVRVQQLVLGRIEELLRPHGLTFARFEVLRLLAFSRQGVLPVGKVGERLQVHPASVTNAVQRLEDAGLVTRSANPLDGRSVLVAITADGADLVGSCTELLNRAVFAPLPLDPHQRDTATAVLRSLRAAFGD